MCVGTERLREGFIMHSSVNKLRDIYALHMCLPCFLFALTALVCLRLGESPPAHVVASLAVTLASHYSGRRSSAHLILRSLCLHLYSRTHTRTTTGEMFERKSSLSQSSQSFYECPVLEYDISFCRDVFAHILSPNDSLDGISVQIPCDC